MTMPASSTSQSKKGAKSSMTEPTSAAGGSRAPSRGPSHALSPAPPEPEKRKVQETEEYLRAAFNELFQCKKQRDLRDRLNALNQEFYARERARKQAASTNQTLGKGELGFSHSKKHHEEKRQLQYKASDILDFDRLMQANKDVEIYDSDADDEADQLEIAIDREKNSQVRRKAACQKATEKWDKQTIVSRRERTKAYLALANQLTYSEQEDWLDALKKLDSAPGY